MAEIVKNLSENTIGLPQVSAPSTTTDKLYNVGGSLTWNGIDISAGGGISNVVEDTTPQLGGDLDVNGFDITAVNGVGNDVTITTSAATPSGGSGKITVAAANANALVNSLIAGQDETDYLFDFSGGTGHAVSDVITMTDGSTVTVDSLSGSAVLTFTVTTSGGVDVPIHPHPQNLLQSSTTGSGTGFYLQPDSANIVQDAQTGGSLTLTAGDGGTSNTGGGDVTITSGRQRGEILIQTGDARTTGNGAYAGKIDIKVGTSFQSSGENVNIFGGNADYEGGDAFGGNVRIVGGNAFGTGGDPDNSYGGDIRLEAGRATYGFVGDAPYEGGEIRLTGGYSLYYGGDIRITSGDTSEADGIAGGIWLETPSGGYGSSIRVYGGSASFAGAAGADIKIKAGNSAGGAGGDVEFTFGTGSTSTGAMIINTSAAPAVTTNKLYNVAGALTWNGTDLTAGGGGISNVVEDTTPQLGGDLDANGNNIITASVDDAVSDSITITTGGADTVIGFSNVQVGDITIQPGELDNQVIGATGEIAGSLFLTGGNVDGTAPDSGGDVTITAGFRVPAGPQVGTILIESNDPIQIAPINATATTGAGFEIFEDPTNGTNSVTVLAPTSITANRTWTLPQDDPTSVAGDFLTTDSSGVLSFAAAGGGGLTVAVVTATSATAAAAQATMVDDDTAGSTVTITLPAGSANDQQVIKKLGTTANVIIDGDSAETIDGAATFTLTAQYASLSLIWNGTEWSII